MHTFVTCLLVAAFIASTLWVVLDGTVGAADVIRHPRKAGSILARNLWGRE